MKYQAYKTGTEFGVGRYSHGLGQSSRGAAPSQQVVSCATQMTGRRCCSGANVKNVANVKKLGGREEISSSISVVRLMDNLRRL